MNLFNKKLLLLTLLITLGTSGCSQVPLSSTSIFSKRIFKEKLKPEEIKVNLRKWSKTHFTLKGSHESCFIHWKFDEKTLVTENYQCMAPLSESFPIINKMLTQFTKQIDPRKIQLFKTQVRFYMDIEQEIAALAYLSNSWDIKKGEPTSGTFDSIIKKLAIKSPSFKILRSSFANECFDFTIDKVLSPRVTQAYMLPFYPYLRENKIKRKALLPANYTLLITIAPKNDFCFADR